MSTALQKAKLRAPRNRTVIVDDNEVERLRRQLVIGDPPTDPSDVRNAVVCGDAFEVLKKLEQLETKREGIFVMPKERIEILSTYVIGGDENNTVDAECARAKKESREKQLRIDSLLRELHEIRASKLPS